MPKNKDVVEEIPAEAPVVEPERAPIEAWAERKGMLPQFYPSGATAIGLAANANPAYWKFAAAKAFMRWSDGQSVTEAEFDEAVCRQETQVIR